MGEAAKSVGISDRPHRTASPNQPQSTTQETTMNTMTTSSSLRGLITAAIFGALASSFSAVSAADDSTDLPTTVVQYQDLNISNPQGAAALYGRIRTAAGKVCSIPGDTDFAAKLRVSPCVHKAIADAVTAINQPALVAVYNANNRTPLPVILAAGQVR
jgi:UrcA family protein